MAESGRDVRPFEVVHFVVVCAALQVGRSPVLGGGGAVIASSVAFRGDGRTWPPADPLSSGPGKEATPATATINTATSHRLASELPRQQRPDLSSAVSQAVSKA